MSLVVDQLETGICAGGVDVEAEITEDGGIFINVSTDDFDSLNPLSLRDIEAIHELSERVIAKLKEEK